MPHIVDPTTKRYKFAQKVLQLLFGYKGMYISIWPHSALSAGGLFIHNNKLLIAKRGGNIEHSGKWYIPGGHIDNEKLETPLEALRREMYEEHKLNIDISKMDEHKPFVTFLYKNHSYTNMKGTTLLEQNFIYEMNTDEVSNLQTTKEAPSFMFASKADLEEMKNKNMLLKDMSFMYKIIK